MFINNGKSLFGNKGLLISISILILLVFFSYNKCYNNYENFNTNSLSSQIATTVQAGTSGTSGKSDTDVPIVLDPPYVLDKSNRIPNTINRPIPQLSFIPPKDVFLKISKTNVILNFSIDNSSTNQIPKSFMIVLVQYDNNKINTGNNKFYVSNESVLNPKLSSTTSEKNTCSIVDSVPKCQYVFNNVDIYDSKNNVFYYKIGVSAIYENGNSPYIIPSNLSTSNNLFTLVTSLDNQNQKNIKPTISANTYNNTISTADGKYELIKSQLGHYPDNLVLDSQSVNSNTLSDLVDKSMAQAVINVKLSTS